MCYKRKYMVNLISFSLSPSRLLLYFAVSLFMLSTVCLLFSSDKTFRRFRLVLRMITAIKMKKMPLVLNIITSGKLQNVNFDDQSSANRTIVNVCNSNFPKRSSVLLLRKQPVLPPKPGLKYRGTDSMESRVCPMIKSIHGTP